MTIQHSLLASADASHAPPDTIHDDNILIGIANIEALIAPHIKPDAGVHAVVAEITPELAAELLRYNLEGNRRTPPGAIAKLGRVIGTDKWKLNGETLKFSIDGVLIDGQTRLKACVETGRLFVTTILFGVPDDAYDSLDQGRRRKVSDALTRKGVHYATVVASAVTGIDAIANRQAPFGNIGQWHGSDADEAIQFVDENPRITDSVVATSPAAKLAPHSLIAALHYHFAARDPEEANRFFSDLASGADLGPRDPVYVLREKLNDDIRRRATRREAVSRWNVSAWVILAWNARRRRRSMTKFPPRILVKDESDRLVLPLIGE